MLFLSKPENVIEKVQVLIKRRVYEALNIDINDLLIPGIL